MENAALGIVLIGDTFTDILSDNIRKTLHLDIINKYSLLQSPLESLLNETPSRGFIFDNVISDEDSFTALLDWQKQTGISLIYFFVNSPTFDNKLLSLFQATDFKLMELDSKKAFKEVNRELFIELSSLCFQEPGLAKKYYQFKDFTERLGIPYVIVSGACSYFYYGKRSLKDIDVIVPSKEALEKLSHATHKNVKWSTSSCAEMYYMNFDEVDVNAEIAVYNQSNKIHFNYEFLAQDSITISFLGEDVNIMSAEKLVLFKFSLGRFGIDDFNDYKDDFEDVRGVLISQAIDYKKLRSLAKGINATEKLEHGLMLLGVTYER